MSNTNGDTTRLSAHNARSRFFFGVIRLMKTSRIGPAELTVSHRIATEFSSPVTRVCPSGLKEAE